MNQELTGGAKAGYFALGLFLNLIGVLIAWLISKGGGQRVKSGAITFSLIGFAVSVVGWIVLYMGLATLGVSLLAFNGQL